MRRRSILQPFVDSKKGDNWEDFYVHRSHAAFGALGFTVLPLPCVEATINTRFNLTWSKRVAPRRRTCVCTLNSVWTLTNKSQEDTIHFKRRYCFNLSIPGDVAWSRHRTISSSWQQVYWKPLVFIFCIHRGYNIPFISSKTTHSLGDPTRSHLMFSVLAEKHETWRTSCANLVSMVRVISLNRARWSPHSRAYFQCIYHAYSICVT